MGGDGRHLVSDASLDELHDVRRGGRDPPARLPGRPLRRARGVLRGPRDRWRAADAEPRAAPPAEGRRPAADARAAPRPPLTKPRRRRRPGRAGEHANAAAAWSPAGHRGGSPNVSRGQTMPFGPTTYHSISSMSWSAAMSLASSHRSMSSSARRRGSSAGTGSGARWRRRSAAPAVSAASATMLDDVERIAASLGAVDDQHGGAEAADVEHEGDGLGRGGRLIAKRDELQGVGRRAHRRGSAGMAARWTNGRST